MTCFLLRIVCGAYIAILIRYLPGGLVAVFLLLEVPMTDNNL